MPYTIEAPTGDSKYKVEPPRVRGEPVPPTLADYNQPSKSATPPETVAESAQRGFSEAFGEGAPFGETALSWLTQPARAALAGTRGLAGAAQRVVGEHVSRDLAATPEAFAGSPGMFAVPAGAAATTSEALFPGAAAALPRTLETRAQDIVSKAFGKSVKGGETTALDAVNEIAAARQSGQPLTIADIGGRPVQRLAGTVFRSGGEAASHMTSFFKGRGTALTPDLLNTVAGQRIETAIADNIATGSYRQATGKLISERSERARPLWDSALEGGSLAPLEHQFGQAFNEASAAESAALRDLTAARNEATQAAARQSVAGNVYSASGSSRPARDTQAKVKAAEFAVQQARKTADESRALLRRAQDDGTANAPGAVWSPRLQQFLNLPDWQKGIRRGLVQEKRDSVTENRTFNPREYAIVDTDAKGDPVVGAVPTMKLLQIAREGISGEIDKMRDPLTGGLTKAGRSLWRNLKAFEEEGDRLNPEWRVARDAWSSDSDSIRSLQLGKKIFNIPLEDLADDFGKMSKSDKEVFKLAAASKAVEDVRKTPLAGDPSKRVINNADELMRLRLLFDNQQEFEGFVNQINRERVMFTTAGEVMRGSQTAERLEADLQTGMDLAHGIGRLFSANPLAAIPALSRASKGLGLRDNPLLNLEVAKVLTDPKATIATAPLRKESRFRTYRPLSFGADEAMRRAAGASPP